MNNPQGVSVIRSYETSLSSKHSTSTLRSTVMGVGAYLFGEGYPSPMFENGH